MKKYLNENKKIFIVITVLIVTIVALSIYLFIDSRTNSIPSTNDTTRSTSDEKTAAIVTIMKTETDITTSVQDVAREYISKTYSGAENIEPQVELVGRGVGIINATYQLNGESMSRKIYLHQNDNQWRIIYDGTGTIPCSIVSAEISEETFLSSYCEN